MILGLIGEAGSGKTEVAQYLVQKHHFYEMAFSDPMKVYCAWMFHWTPEVLFGPSGARNTLDTRYPFYACPHCGFTHPLLQESLREHRGGPFECPYCQRYSPATKWTRSLSARYALQSLGDWARQFNPHAYVHCALKRIDAVNKGMFHDPLSDALENLNMLDTRWIHEVHLPVNRVVISDVRFVNEAQALREAGAILWRITRPQKENTTTTGIPEHPSEIQSRTLDEAFIHCTVVNQGSLDNLFQHIDTLTEIFDDNEIPTP